MTGSQLPADEAELYRLFIRGAVPFPTVSAAVDLVFRVPELRQWLIGNNLAVMGSSRGMPTVEVDFQGATEKVCAAVFGGSFESEFTPGDSGRGVLWLAASLAGVPGLDPLRFFLEDLSERDAQLCAEAIMYSAGFMDGFADPNGGLESDAMGPKGTLYDDLLWS